MIARLTQSGLGLPDRDYYLSEDAGPVQKRTAYQAYLAQLLTLAGERNGPGAPPPCSPSSAGIAEAHWTRIQNRDEEATYNRWAIADFARNAPGFDWARYFQETGLSGQAHILVSQPSTFTATARIVSRDAGGGAQGLYAAAPRRQCGALSVAALRRRQFRLPRHRAQRHAAEQPTAGSAASTWSPPPSPTTSAGSTSSVISRPRPSARPTLWSATSSRRWTAASPA